MARMPRIVCYVTAIWIIALAMSNTTASAVVGTGESVADQIDIPYTSFVLDNGLRVYVLTDHSSPTVLVGMYYFVGSKDEPVGKTGFAHLFEHLMFQGSENRDGEYFTPLTEAGASGVNGGTQSDFTYYVAEVPKQALDLALWMESDRMTHLLGAVTQEVLDEQRAVVKNEKRQRGNTASARSYPRVLEGFYPIGHPYRHSPIGSMEDLNNASLEDVHEWFRKYYGASNASLILIGDIDLETAKQKVAHYFNDAPAGEALPSLQEWVPTLQSNKIDVVQERVSQGSILRKWHLPPASERETALMSLVATTLAGNKNSPLRRKLVDDLQLATDVGAYAYGSMLTGEFAISVSLASGADPKAVEAVIDEVVSSYLKSGADMKILEAARLAESKRLVEQLELNAYKMFHLGYGLVVADDPEFVKKQLQWNLDASRSELRQAANKWLANPYYQLTTEPFPDYSVAKTGADRSALPSVEDVAYTVQFPDAQEFALENGLKLVVADKPGLPLVKVYVQIETGSNADSDSTFGAAQAVFSLLDKGTRKFSSSEFSTELDKIAMSPLSQVGSEFSYISYSILAPQLEASLGLAMQMLSNAKFDAAEIEKLKEKWILELELNQNEPHYTLLPKLFTRAIYGEESDVGRIIDTNMVERLTQNDIATFYKREVTPSKTTVFIVGDLTLYDINAVVDRTLAKWSRGTPSKLAPIGDAQSKSPRIILVDQPDSLQSRIYAGHALPKFDPETDPELDVLLGVLGSGFSSRMNLNLREDKGWTYGAQAYVHNEVSGVQSLIVTTSVQTDRTKESMVEIKKELDVITSTNPITVEEYERFVLNTVRGQAGRYATSDGYLYSIIDSTTKGLPYNYAEGDAERIANVSLSDANAIGEELIDSENLTWLIVGDLDEIEDNIRSLNYGAMEVWDVSGNRIR